MTREQLDIPMIAFAAAVVVSILAARACALCGLTWAETVLIVPMLLAAIAAACLIVRSIRCRGA